ncbi:N-acetylmuramoyl-L-alanine amidase [Caniella muris]|uniref:N-acetylmuramoyl-L-alanine amidase n=1 Tax=Caniella muris TaxID=2941502 RepID=UPI00203B812E|nr:N-acetylmuramoyl-L-alanine amidase [Caniella muris]
MPKASLNGGHSPYAPGASGYFDEVTEDRRVRAACDRYLKQMGWSTHDSSTEERSSKADLSTIVSRANGSKADYFVSFHFNSGGGTGTEVFYYAGSKSPWPKDMAAKVSAAVSGLLGIPNRGAKDDTQSAVKKLTVLRKTDMPAILVEVCFLDSKADSDAYLRVGADAVGRCIAECIAGKTATATPAAPAPSKPATAPAKPAASTSGFGGRYRVNCDVLNVRSGPGTKYAKVTQYKRGETVVLDDWYKSADGYIWGRYTGASSGKLRYVAVGKATGKPEADDYLVKV